MVISTLPPLLPRIDAILILDGDGNRLAGKYYGDFLTSISSSSSSTITDDEKDAPSSKPNVTVEDLRSSFERQLQTKIQGIAARPDAAAFLRPLALCVVYIALSAGLIEFNKFLMSPGRFPHAMALTCIHMASTFLLCNAFYWIRPDFYPTMQQTKGKRLQLLAWFCPLAVLFAVGLFCSNQAYIYCSPAFLQFMKEGNVVLVFALSCLVGLQICTRARFVNIVWILTGASMAVSGQVHFVMAGFVFQLVSQLGECGKNVMGDWMMKSHLKLDALTYTMFLSPMCLLVLLVGAAVTWKAQILTDFVAWWMYIVPNACLAFVMNVTVSLLIKECSAFAFILAGLVKDAFIVAMGASLLGETVVGQQYTGFVVCLSGVFFWSYSRIDPHAPLVQLFQKATCSVREETIPLLAEAQVRKDEEAPLLPKNVA